MINGGIVAVTDVEVTVISKGSRTTLPNSLRLRPGHRTMQKVTTTLDFLNKYRARALSEMPLLGRSRELSKLEAAVASSSPALIEGSTGLGKTRLLLELGRVHTKRKASTMSANEKKPRKRTSSFSNREKIRRKPLSLRNSRSISFRFL